METKVTTPKFEIDKNISVEDNYIAMQSFIDSLPQINKPKKPILSSKHSSEDVIKYGTDLAQYEIDLAAWGKQYKKYQAICADAIDEVIDFAKVYSGLNTIPEQYQDKVYSYAWRQSHSEGVLAVYYTLRDIVSTIFE